MQLRPQIEPYLLKECNVRAPMALGHAPKQANLIVLSYVDVSIVASTHKCT